MINYPVSCHDSTLPALLREDKEMNEEHDGFFVWLMEMTFVLAAPLLTFVIRSMFISVLWNLYVPAMFGLQEVSPMNVLPFVVSLNIATGKRPVRVELDDNWKRGVWAAILYDIFKNVLLVACAYVIAP